jgi:hypothetical protein
MTIAGRFLIGATGLLLAAALAGCGGGGHAVPAAGSAVVPAANGRGSASFTITVPSATSTATLRRAAYISSSTTAVRIDVESGGSEVAGFPVTVPVTPGSPNCTTTVNGTTCAITVSVLPGTYTATVTALDVHGNPISTAVAVPVDVAPGTVTNVPLTLNGVVATLNVTPTVSGGAPTYVSGSAAAGFGLIGQGPRSFTIAAADANGNTIVGAGAPTFSVTQSGPIALQIVQPTTNAPNTFTLAAPYAWVAGNDQVTVNVAYPDGASCASSGGICSVPLNVSMRELLLFVNNVTGTSLTLIPDGDTTPIGTITTGIVSSSPAWGSPTGDIVAGNAPGYLGTTLGNSTIYAFPYQSAPYAIVTTSTNSTNAIVWTAQFDPSGNLVVTDYFGNTIRAFAPPFSTPASLPSTPFATITGLSEPGAFSIGPQGNLFVGNSGTQTVTEYAAKTFAGPIVPPIAPPFTTGPYFCCITTAESPAGKLAVTSGLEPTVWLYDPPYTGAPSATLAIGTTNNGVFFAADGTLFVATATGGLIYAPPYTGAPQIFTPSSPPQQCTLDAAATILCSISNTVMGYYPRPYGAAPTQTITTGINRTSTPVVVP